MSHHSIVVFTPLDPGQQWLNVFKKNNFKKSVFFFPVVWFDLCIWLPDLAIKPSVFCMHLTWARPTSEDFCVVSKEVLCWTGWSIHLCLCFLKDPLKCLKVDNSQDNAAFWMLLIFSAFCCMEKTVAVGDTSPQPLGVFCYLEAHLWSEKLLYWEQSLNWEEIVINKRIVAPLVSSSEEIVI